MPQFTVDTLRFDPYKTFKFRVKWDGKYVAGVSKVGTLSSARHPRSRIRRSFFWTELDAWSRRMLLEVHQLAIRYGWSEQRF